MTAKEKAEELVNKYYIFNHIGNRHAVKCALIAVDELIESFNAVYDSSIRNIEKYSGARFGMKDYWQEVKQEIERL
jgi:hypothetical protein